MHMYAQEIPGKEKAPVTNCWLILQVLNKLEVQTKAVFKLVSLAKSGQHTHKTFKEIWPFTG